MRADDLIITVEQRKQGASRPYHRQVFTQVRDAILDGTLRAGDRLPSTRDLALTLGLARNTVARAYDDLLAGGYLEGRVGAGTFVSAGAGEPPRAQGGGKGRPASAPRLPTGVVPAPVAGPSDPGIDLRPGTADWDAFPRGVWLRLLGRALRTNAAELRRYGEPGGHFPLREAIARHLAVSRGVAAQAEQVVIVNGSQQALDLVARLCLRAGDSAVVEEPGYPDARRVLTASAARVLPVPVDDDGLDVGRLERAARSLPARSLPARSLPARSPPARSPPARSPPAPRLVYVTPSHQFPTGAVLSLPRRLALLGWAAGRDSYIVEDDYDSEFHAPGRMVESLQGLDRARKVIYIGTFSTALFPPLRVGFVVLPPDLVDPFVSLKWLADRQTPTLEQLALTDFLQEGHFERHLRRMRRLVSARREAMRAAIGGHLGAVMEASGSNAGMHVMVTVTASFQGAPAADIERRIVEAAARRGVAVSPAGPCYARRSRRAAFVLGYASLDEGLIADGVRRLARAAAEVDKTRA